MEDTRRMKRRRARDLYQPTSVACGVTCVANAAQSYGLSFISFNDIARACELSRDGTSIQNIIDGAKRLGLEASACRMSVNRASEEKLPIIAFLSYGHFIVVEKIQSDYLVVFDPAKGRYQIDKSRFREISSGIFIRLGAARKSAHTVKIKWPRKVLAIERLVWLLEKRWWAKRKTLEIIQKQLN